MADDRARPRAGGESMSTGGAGPDAMDRQRDRIVFWHARAHDKLDTYGVPRFVDGMELMLEERIARLEADLAALREAAQAVVEDALAELIDGSTFYTVSDEKLDALRAVLAADSEDREETP